MNWCFVLMFLRGMRELVFCIDVFAWYALIGVCIVKSWCLKHLAKKLY